MFRRSLFSFAMILVSAVCVAAPGELFTFVSNPTAGQTRSAGFGNALAATGSTLIVGAPDHRESDYQIGAVHFYDLNSGGYVRTLYSPAPQVGEEFGAAVAAKGKYVAVGAPGSYSNDGVVYVFDVNTGGVFHTIRSPLANSAFGQSLAISGNALAAGAPRAAVEGRSRAGQVYVYDLKRGRLLYSQDQQSPRASANFPGALAAIAGGFACGTYQDDDGSTNAGSVTTMRTRDGAITQFISNPTPGWGDLFGRSIAGFGNRFFVGEPMTTATSAANGSVHVFSTKTGARLLEISNPAPDPQLRIDQFGTSLAAAKNRILVGAPRDTVSDTRSGAAYLYDWNGACLTTFTSPWSTSGDRFGTAVLLAGNKMVISAPLTRLGNGSRGVVYLFEIM